MNNKKRLQDYTIEELKKLKEEFGCCRIRYLDLPQPILAALFLKAVQRIDLDENVLFLGNEDDQRTIFDSLDDQIFIVTELFDEVIDFKKKFGGENYEQL